MRDVALWFVPLDCWASLALPTKDCRLPVWQAIWELVETEPSTVFLLVRASPNGCTFRGDWDCPLLLNVVGLAKGDGDLGLPAGGAQGSGELPRRPRSGLGRVSRRNCGESDWLGRRWPPIETSTLAFEPRARCSGFMTGALGSRLLRGLSVEVDELDEPPIREVRLCGAGDPRRLWDFGELIGASLQGALLTPLRGAWPDDSGFLRSESISRGTTGRGSGGDKDRHGPLPGRFLAGSASILLLSLRLLLEPALVLTNWSHMCPGIFVSFNSTELQLLGRPTSCCS